MNLLLGLLWGLNGTLQVKELGTCSSFEVTCVISEAIMEAPVETQGSWRTVIPNRARSRFGGGSLHRENMGCKQSFKGQKGGEGRKGLSKGRTLCGQKHGRGKVIVELSWHH